jgi:hypothetical protein
MADLSDESSDLPRTISLLVKRKRAPVATDPPRNSQPDSSGEADKLAAIIQLRLGWTGFARPPVGDSTIARARYAAMLCLEAGETPKLNLLNARRFLSASAHECLVEDPVLFDPSGSCPFAAADRTYLPGSPKPPGGRLRAPTLTNFASLLTITYHERPLNSLKIPYSTPIRYILKPVPLSSEVGTSTFCIRLEHGQDLAMPPVSSPVR